MYSTDNAKPNAETFKAPKQSDIVLGTPASGATVTNLYAMDTHTYILYLQLMNGWWTIPAPRDKLN